MAQQSGEFTRTGARRSGDDYQDVVALDVFVEWLEHPERFQRAKLEADDSGFLDDVRVERPDRVIVLKQVKFSTDPDNPDDAWTFEMLLSEKEGKPNKEGKKKKLPSLISKWAQSVKVFEEEAKINFEASVVSNRRPAADLAAALLVRQLEYDKITDSATRSELVRQIGTEAGVRKFFSQFQFRLDQPSLEVLEDGVRRRFFSLGGTGPGWLNLKDTVRAWMRRRNNPPPDGWITLDHVRKAALWNALKPLPQEIEIPSDYVLASATFDEGVIEGLLRGRTPARVIQGKPGVGKSTYASYLFQELRKRGVPVVRHHYFRSLKERNTARLQHERVAESLMHDLLADHEADTLSNLAARNPKPSDLRCWLEGFGKHYQAQGRALAVIIDGLDHVWREQTSTDELRKLFDLICPPAPGVVLLVFTQPVEDSKFPPSLLRAAPRQSWLELPLLDQGGVERWLEKHKTELGKSEQERNFLFPRVAAALFSRSGGHPLHLHYSLHSLKTKGLPVTPQQIAALPACAHADIENYYAELWRTLTAEGRLVLQLLAACRFPWPDQGLIETLVKAGSQLSDAVAGREQVQHLLATGELGLQPFHGSLLIFIEGQPGYEAVRSRLQRAALQWLETEAPDYWRWAYLWRLRADMGEEQPLRDGPNREWLIESLALRRPPSEIQNILSRSTWLALKASDLPRGLELGVLRDYYTYMVESEPEVFVECLGSQVDILEEKHLLSLLHARCAELRDKEIAYLATAERKQGNGDRVDDCFAELANRWNHQISRPQREYEHSRERNPNPLVEVAAIASEDVFDVTFDFAVRNRDTDQSTSMLKTLARRVRAFKDSDRMRRLLGLSLRTDPSDPAKPLLNNDEFSVVAEEAALLALEERLDFDDLLLTPRVSGNSLVSIYAALRGKPQVLGKLQPLATGVLKLKQYELYQHSAAMSGLIRLGTYYFLANNLARTPEENTRWLDAIPSEKWVRSLLLRLNAISQQLANFLTESASFDLGWFYDQLSEIPRPEFGPREEDWDWGRAASFAANRLGLELSELFQVRAAKAVVRQADLEKATRSGYCNIGDWLRELVNNRRPLLTTEALEWLLAREAKELGETIAEFRDRAEHCATIAAVCGLHRAQDKARNFIRRAADNLIAHTGHKDMLLFQPLEAIQICSRLPKQTPVPDVRKWLFQLAPAIAQVEKFTDRDETGHLPREMAEVLADVAPDILPVYYAWLLDNEEYYDALHAFRTFVNTADLTNPFNRAVAQTAVDRKASEILVRRADGGDSQARVVIRSLAAVFGDEILKPIPEKYRSSSTISDGLESTPAPDPSCFPPDKFAEYLAAAEGRSWRGDKLCEDWISYWIKAGKKMEVYQALKAACERDEFFRNYDRLFALALDLFGKEEAYRWLVKAHRKDHGWSRYWTDASKAHARFAALKLHYPERWMDFIRDTVKSEHGEPWSDLSIGSGVWVRMLELCVELDQFPVAVASAQQMVASALGLVPLRLPVATWTLPSTSANRSLDMLFEQLRWPSVLVKERACTAISELIRDPAHSEETGRKLIQWLNAQTLESTVAYGLLAVIRSITGGAKLAPTFQGQLAEAAKRPSLLSWLLLEALDTAGHQKLEDCLRYTPHRKADFIPPKFFEGYVESFLPPSYADAARMVERHHPGLDFMRHWAFEWSNIIQLSGIRQSAESGRFWGEHDADGARYGPSDTVMSEAYRSAFLRTLAWAIADRGFPQGEALFFAARACPVDVELWPLRPLRRPAWWPHSDEVKASIDLGPAEIWRQIASLWDKQSKSQPWGSDESVGAEWMLASANGSITWGEHCYMFEIFGGFQKCVGPNSPEICEVAAFLAGESDRVEHPRLDGPSLLHFSGRIRPRSPNKFAAEFSGWSIVPAGFRTACIPVPRWQFWRFGGVWLPAPFLGTAPLRVGRQRDFIVASVEDKVVSQWCDWTAGIGEKHTPPLPFPSGQVMAIPRKVVTDFEAATDSTFVWICRLKTFHRQHDYDGFQIHTECRHFGASRFIRKPDT